MFLVYFHSKVSSTGLLFLNSQYWKLLNENKPETLGLFRKVVYFGLFVVYFWFIIIDTDGSVGAQPKMRKPSN